MIGELNTYEARLIKTLMRVHRERIADLSRPFTSKQAVDFIRRVPTSSGHKRSASHLPNKYKLCFIMKKSKAFACEIDGSGRRWWTLKSN